MEELHRAFELPARFPRLGRDIGHIRPGCRRFERASHVVFHGQTDAGIIIIVRVLHRRMEPRHHL